MTPGILVGISEAWSITEMMKESCDFWRVEVQLPIFTQLNVSKYSSIRCNRTSYTCANVSHRRCARIRQYWEHNIDSNHLQTTQKWCIFCAYLTNFYEGKKRKPTWMTRQILISWREWEKLNIKEKSCRRSQAKTKIVRVFILCLEIRSSVENYCIDLLLGKNYELNENDDQSILILCSCKKFEYHRLYKHCLMLEECKHTNIKMKIVIKFNSEMRSEQLSSDCWIA